MSIDRMALADSLKLRNYLRTLSDSKLISISQHWNIAIDPEKRVRNNVLQAIEIADFLYPRMASQQYFSQAFEKLNKPESETVQFIAVQGCTLSVSELSERLFRGNIKSATSCVLSLEKKGFAFLDIERPGMLPADDKWVVIPEAYLRNLDFPPHWQGFLGNLLRTLDKDILHTIVRRVMPDYDPNVSPINDIRYELRQRLLEPGFIESLVASLSSTESVLFHNLVERKGNGLYRDLLDITNTRKLDHSRAEELNHLILTSGLIFTVAEGHNKYMNSLVIPRDIFYTITRRYQKDNRSLQRIDSTGVKKRDIKPVTIVDNSAQLLRDLAVLAGRIDIGKVKQLTSGGINRSDLRRVTTVFPNTKSPRYLQTLALYLSEAEKFVGVNGNWIANEDFISLSSNPLELYQSLVGWWLDATIWNELYTDGLVLSSEKPPQLWINVVELRREILRFLQQGSKDRWLSFSGFWESASPQLEANLSRGIGGGGYGGILTAKDATSVILKESLTWLGMVQHGEIDQTPISPRRAGGKNTEDESQEEPDFAFQLTDLGRHVCDSLFSVSDTIKLNANKTGSVSSYGSEWVFVQPNLEVVAPPDLNLSKLFLLVRMSEVKNLDVMTTLEITRDSVRAVVERGASENELKSILKSLSRSDVPATVLQLIEECTARHGEVRVGACGGYILADEPLLIESIIRNSKTSPFIKEKHGENLVLLADDVDINKVARELRNQGHMPKVDDDGVHMSSDGRFHLNLNEMEMQDVVAAVRFLNFVEMFLEDDFSEGRSGSLIHRLRQGGSGFMMTGNSNDDVRFKQMQKKFESAVANLTDKVEDKYKNQVTKLVSRSNTSRGASKYQFKGPNPAVERQDIVDMLMFAHDFDLEVELLYIKQNEQEAKIVIHPKGVEGDRLYAHNPVTDVDAIYSIPKILRAKLI